MPQVKPNLLPPNQTSLEDAQAGICSARDELSRWVYNEGLNYFTSRIRTEPLLGPEEAQDLAGESLLEFQKALPRIRTLPRYVRRMFRNNLIRHLTRKRARRNRECLGQDQFEEFDFIDSIRDSQPQEAIEWSDKEAYRIYYSRRCLSEADPIMKTIWLYRLADEPLGYRQIGEIMGMEEAALRMRVARFCKGVRLAVKRKERRRVSQGHGSHGMK
ncbi:sigma-70 family RNA polymerase sigma factor [bacterium]|nr:sigma-70 family RNA polymerase sigma factor [bacterium]